MTIFYMGLEKIQSRYSHQLTDWNMREFKRMKLKYQIVNGQELPSVKGRIVTGSVLDAHGRTYYSMTQMASLIALMKAGKVTNKDVVFFEDMFTPGIESMAYIMDQVHPKYRPKIFVRCLAQTIDPDDFVHRCGMFDWMRNFEKMLDSFVTGILVASEEMVAHLRIAGFKAPIYVTGLPFGKREVQSRVPHLHALHQRAKLVTYAARFDDEKQPLFFLDVIDRVRELDPTIKFQILTGNKKLTSNNAAALALAKSYRRRGKLVIREGLTKNEYYQHLASSRLLFNCALQDWVSNTVSEADTLGCMTLFPAYRSFPEVFANDPAHMYIPWSVEDAATKLVHLVNLDATQSIGEVSNYQDKSIERTVEVFKGRASERVDYPDYRKYVAEAKY